MPRPIIGVDLDNTIVCYDGLFNEVGIKYGFIDADLQESKIAVRDHLRGVGREDDWTLLQGLVYGPMMARAKPYPGVSEFFEGCRNSEIKVFIISHRTKYPYIGKKYNLHDSAYKWLEMQKFSLIENKENAFFFESTKEEKLDRISKLKCTHFIDDLPEFLKECNFPNNVDRILFDPTQQHIVDSIYDIQHSWSGISANLLLR